MVPQASVMFTSKAAYENGTVNSYNLKKQVEIVKNCRTVTKHDMKFNNAMPEMEVDPEYFVSSTRLFASPLDPLLIALAVERCGRWREMCCPASEFRSSGSTTLPLLRGKISTHLVGAWIGFASGFRSLLQSWHERVSFGRRSVREPGQG